MKQDIHPTFFPQARVVCSCGHTFSTGSTKAEIRVEICSKCHPFYTGEKRLLDTMGRVEKFQARQTAGASYIPKKVKQKAKQESQQPKTLKEMFELIK